MKAKDVMNLVVIVIGRYIVSTSHQPPVSSGTANQDISHRATPYA
jgi:hypothetical protein